MSEPGLPEFKNCKLTPKKKKKKKEERKREEKKDVLGNVSTKLKSFHCFCDSI